MSEHNDAIQKQLWAVFNDGKMPVEIRVKYSKYCTMMMENEFCQYVELAHDDKPLTYQGVPIVFDDWCNVLTIRSVPRETTVNKLLEQLK